MDYHASLPQMPPEAMEQMRSRTQAGQVDEFGYKRLNIFIGSGGQAYCLTEAPNVEAVAKSHQAARVPVSTTEIVEVTSLV